MNEVKPGDLIAFYVMKSMNGIVAIYRVVSHPFEGHEDLWGGNRYPYRVHIEAIAEFMKDERNPVPLHAVFGRLNEKLGIIIEPYLRGVSLVKLNDKQSQRLKDVFRYCS